MVPASFYAFYLSGLERLLPAHVTQLVLVAVGSLLAVVGALLGPETRDVDLSRPDLRRRAEVRRAQPRAPVSRAGM